MNDFRSAWVFPKPCVWGLLWFTPKWHQNYFEYRWTLHKLDPTFCICHPPFNRWNKPSIPSPNLCHLKVLPGSWSIHGSVLSLSSWDWLWYLSQLLSFRTRKVKNFSEFCKQRNQVIFLMLTLPQVTHYTRLLLWAGFAVGAQRTVRAGAGTFRHHGSTGESSGWSFRGAEWWGRWRKLAASLIFRNCISHIMCHRLAKYGAKEKTRSQ